MSRMTIVVGDLTSGGGRVITGSPSTDIDGIPVSRVGDQASCAKHNGVFSIASGDATVFIDGQPVARHGDHLACGCQLISIRQFRVFLDEGVSDNPAANEAVHRIGGASPPTATEDPERYDEAFVLISEFTERPLANRRYKIVRKAGAAEEGTTDTNGATHLVKSRLSEVLRVELGEEELP